MNTYEALLIFKPILDVENVDAILMHFEKNLVNANQGVVLDTDRIGRKRLAYEIKKFKDGFLTLLLVQFPSEKVIDFKRACQLNEDLLRMTLVRQEETTFRETYKEEGRREFGNRRGPREGGFRDNREGGGGRDGGGDEGRREFGNRRPIAGASSTEAPSR